MPPLHLLIKPASSACNLRCKYCFYADVSAHRETRFYGFMSEQLLAILVRRALEEAEGSCTFAFQGGEPTLVGLDFYRRLIDLQKTYNKKRIPIHNAIQTNGVALDDSWASFLAENRFLVGLSLDGYRELQDFMRTDPQGNGSYDAVMRTAASFDRYGVQYNILCVVNRYVARHPQKVYRALRHFGYLQFIPCLDGFDAEKQPYSLTPQDYAHFLTSVFDLYYRDFIDGRPVSVRDFDNYIQMLLGMPPEACGMNGVCSCAFTVEGDGSVFPCDFYVLDAFRLGNVRDMSFSDMRNSEAALAFLRPSRHVREECRACPWFRLCRGGCRRYREPFSDGLPGRNMFCDAYRAFFSYAYPRLAECAQICGRRLRAQGQPPH